MAFELLEERNQIEYKSQVPDDFEETVIAFLNYSEGGIRPLRKSLRKKDLSVKWLMRLL